MNRTHSWRFCRPPPSHLATSAWVGGFVHRTFQIDVSDLVLRIDLRTDSTVNSVVGVVDTVFKFLIWMNLVQHGAAYFSTARHFVNQLLLQFSDIIHVYISTSVSYRRPDSNWHGFPRRIRSPLPYPFRRRRCV